MNDNELDEMASRAGFVVNMMGQIVTPAPSENARQPLRLFADLLIASERDRWAAVCDANASSKRALYAKTESDDDRGAAEMAEWLAGCIRGA